MRANFSKNINNLDAEYLRGKKFYHMPSSETGTGSYGKKEWHRPSDETESDICSVGYTLFGEIKSYLMSTNT